MFADAALAARIDRAEGRFVASVAGALGARRTDLRTLIQPIAGGTSVYAGPNSPMNKVIGLGFDGPIDPEALEEVEREWRARDEAVRIELSILADASIPVMLSERGYHLHGFENVLGRPLGPEPDADDPRGVTVERLRKEDERTLIDIAVAAFTNLDGTGSTADDSSQVATMEEVMEDFLASPGLQPYLARLDGRPVGEGALCIAGDNIALLAGAGTIPDARGRGVQKALLRRRLADAREAGAELAVVVTAPGTRSQENVMRRGFILLYTRIILVKRAPNQ
jgi:GNAT superfamily N-acetyltransferase